jgi:hypothetical protein
MRKLLFSGVAAAAISVTGAALADAPFFAPVGK